MSKYHSHQSRLLWEVWRGFAPPKPAIPLHHNKGEGDIGDRVTKEELKERAHKNLIIIKDNNENRSFS